MNIYISLVYHDMLLFSRGKFVSHQWGVGNKTELLLWCIISKSCHTLPLCKLNSTWFYTSIVGKSTLPLCFFSILTISDLPYQRTLLLIVLWAWVLFLSKIILQFSDSVTFIWLLILNVSLHVPSTSWCMFLPITVRLVLTSVIFFLKIALSQKAYTSAGILLPSHPCFEDRLWPVTNWHESSK